MSCASVVAGSKASCGFAFDKMLLLDARANFYRAVRNATAEAGRAGKLEAPIVAEDLRVLDKKIGETEAKISVLTRCLRA
jgi:hypothetical protein